MNVMMSFHMNSNGGGVGCATCRSMTGQAFRYDEMQCIDDSVCVIDDDDDVGYRL